LPRLFSPDFIKTVKYPSFFAYFEEKIVKPYCGKVKNMLNFENKPGYDFDDLRKLIELLRGPGGCPWDREQTHESIRRNLIEEAYEAAESIDNGDTENLIEELGDVLMQVIFHAHIAEIAGQFDLNDITDATCRKLIRRHPHVFGDISAENGAQSLAFWDSIKREEKKQDTVTDAMRSVARSLPALWRAEKIQQKAAKPGFDWPDHTGALEALDQELGELKDAISVGDGVGEELGDLIFSAVNVARFFDVDPEEALGKSCDKFISRFAHVENESLKQGRDLTDMTLDEMEEIYRQAKADGSRQYDSD